MSEQKLPACKLVIQHDRMPADQWRVMFYVNRVGFSIGAPCETLALAQSVRDDFKKALREIKIAAEFRPVSAPTAGGSCEGCANRGEVVWCLNCTRSNDNRPDNYQAKEA